MISKNKIKLIRSLEQKKFRKEWQLFVAEGHKLVDDLLQLSTVPFSQPERNGWIRDGKPWKRSPVKGVKSKKYRPRSFKKPACKRIRRMCWPYSVNARPEGHRNIS